MESLSASDDESDKKQAPGPSTGAAQPNGAKKSALFSKRVMTSRSKPSGAPVAREGGAPAVAVARNGEMAPIASLMFLKASGIIQTQMPLSNESTIRREAPS